MSSRVHGSYSVEKTADLDLLATLFREIRGFERPLKTFRWLYQDNPAGPAHLWLLRDPSGKAIGFCAGHPREVWVGGKIARALNCGDFCVARGHRTLGPALILRRPAKALVDSGEFDFLYSHPVPSMLVVHRRVGHPRLAEMERWVYPLRSERWLRNQLGGPLGWMAAPLINTVLTWRRRLAVMRDDRFEVRERTSIAEDYDKLDAVLGESYTAIGRRDSAYLTWRFAENPESQATLYEAREPLGGNLVGYLFLESTPDIARVRDIAYVPDEGVERVLIMAALNRASRTKAQSLNLLVQSGFPGSHLLRKFGLIKRSEDQPTVCYPAADFWGKESVMRSEDWFMTLADRDV